jgi:hypothetical protein
MRRFIFPLAVSLCFLFVVSQNTTVTAKDTWVSVRTKNFFMLGNASEKDIRKVGLKLEQFREVFTRLFPGIKFNTPVPTTVVVFKSDSSYMPFKPQANIAGYFQPGSDVNYITLTTEVRGQQDPFTVIFNEYNEGAYSQEVINKIQEHLRKAIELRPDFPESYNLLAFVSLITGQGVDESIAQMKRLLSTSPGRHDFMYMLGQLYARNGEYKNRP